MVFEMNKPLASLNRPFIYFSLQVGQNGACQNGAGVNDGIAEQDTQPILQE